MRRVLLICVAAGLLVTLGGANAASAGYDIVWTGESWPLPDDPGVGNGLALQSDGGETYMWHSAWYSGMLRQLRMSDSATVTECTSPSCSEYPTCESSGLEFMGGYLYHVTGFGKVYQLDPDNCTKHDEMTVSSSPRGLTWDGTCFWTADFDANIWYRFCWGGPMDPIYPCPFGHPNAIAWDGSAIWIGGTDDNYVFKFDPATGAKVDSAFVGELWPVRAMQIVPGGEDTWDIYLVPHMDPTRIHKGLLIYSDPTATVPSTWGAIKSINK